MFNPFTLFESKRPERGCKAAVPLPELPGDMKRILRIQVKTLLNYIEDAEQLAICTSTVHFLEHCLTRPADRGHDHKSKR